MSASAWTPVDESAWKPVPEKDKDKEQKTESASPEEVKTPGVMDKIAAVGGKIDESLKDSAGDGIIKSIGKKAGRAIMGPVNELASTAKGVIDLPRQTQIDENSKTPLPNDEYAIGKMTSLPGTNTSLALPLYKAGKDIIGAAGNSIKAGYQSAKQGEGLPGIALSEMENLPFAGDIVEDMERGNAIGGFTKGLTRTAVIKGMTKAPEVPGIIKAEGNPGAVYNKYLKPVEHVPIEMPKSTPHIERSLINKVQINYPEVADRMRQGATTLGDLDIARQVANDSSKAAYTAKGLPTQISKGFKNVADSLRDTIYPKVEALHNLPEGSLSDLKHVQGSAIEMGKPPKWGHFPTRWPTVAASRLAIRPALDLGRNIKTRVIDAGLPEPQSIDLRSNFPAPASQNGSILKARAEAARPEFGGDQAIPIKPKPRRVVRPLIDVEEEAEPALKF